MYVRDIGGIRVSGSKRFLDILVVCITDRIDRYNHCHDHIGNDFNLSIGSFRAWAFS